MYFVRKKRNATRRIVRQFFTAILLILAIGGAAYAQQAPIVLRYSHNQKTGHPYDIGAQKFAELVAQKTGGKVKVEIYPNSVLGVSTQVVDAVRMGTVDFIVEHTGTFEGYQKGLGVFGIPGLYSSWDHFWSVVDGDIGKEFEKKLENNGFKVLGWQRNGWYHIITNKRVQKPSDLKGFKFRGKPGAIMGTVTDKMYGTVTVSVDYSELYSALQLGLVNGMVQNVTNIRDTTIYEAAPYILLAGPLYATNLLVVSMKTYQKLPKEFQEALLEAGREASLYEREVSVEYEKRDLEWLKQNPKVFITELSPEEKAEWDATSKNAEDFVYQYFGKDLIDRIKALKK